MNGQNNHRAPLRDAGETAGWSRRSPGGDLTPPFKADPNPDGQRNLHAIGLNLRPLAAGEGVCHDLYRTGDVTVLGQAEAGLLREDLGIRYFLDLRGESEQHRHGRAESLARAGISILHWPVMARDASAIAGRRPTSEAYARYYFSIFKEMTATLPQLFAALAELKGGPLLFGCHAGKDRTSLVAMLLLHLCGAERPVIARDHERSGGYLLPHLYHFRDKWERKGETPEEYAVRLDPRGEAMLQTLEKIDADLGGIDACLRRCGVHGDHLQAINHHYAFSTLPTGST
ncbi:MAG: tyrosine-protein phosphatase [Magnetococcales bacterium]|nr:tyrosine-protein phosphatase [Magnetococcales bacterium]